MTRFLPLLLITSTLVACSRTLTEPPFGSGTFGLRSVAGENLPSRIGSNGFGGTYLADTVRFEPRTLALFAQPTVERNTLVENPGGGLHPTVEYIAYERQGDIFQFRYPCPVDADCAIGFIRGSLVGAYLEITLQPPFRSPLRYERVQPQ